jgi:GMP synthase-like glutamine amidotransferase
MRLLVLQHHAAEHPGIFRDFLAEDGVDWDAVQLQAGDPLPSLDLYDALWVMGGPMDVWEETRYPWLAPEKRFIHEAVFEHDLPFLGCCLGHQLLAEVAGGRCRAMQTPEVGIHPLELTPAADDDPLLADTPQTFEALQWHGVEVESVPADVAVLARSPAAEIQAIRVGARAWGLQYHVEVTSTTVDEWGEIPEYADSLQRVFGRDVLPELRAETQARIDTFAASARRIYDRFMRAAR